MSLGNVSGAIPIHGFLIWNNQWRVVEVKADRDAAWVTSRLEFYRNPAWMKQFPFAHTIEITHRLHDGVLQVTTKIENLSTDPMPVSIGFHPYFQLTDSTRDDWTISVGAKTQWLLGQNLIPTGETQPIETVLPQSGGCAAEGLRSRSRVRRPRSRQRRPRHDDRQRQERNNSTSWWDPTTNRS